MWRLFRIQNEPHRFATCTLVNWYRAKKDPERHLPTLSAYLGHVHIADTYCHAELGMTPSVHEFGMAERSGEGEHVAPGSGAGWHVLKGPDGKGVTKRVRGRSASFAGLSQACPLRKLAEHVVRVPRDNQAETQRQSG